jgi:hypothetical protein
MSKLEITQLPNKESWAYRLRLIKRDHKIRIKKDIVPVSEEMGCGLSHATVGKALAGETYLENIKIVEDVIYEIIRRNNGG